MLELENDEETEVEVPIDISTEIEEVRVLTKLSMNSRKLKVNISNQLLQELENLQVDFKLN